ncbi:hypothetical protein H0N96_02635 [Candidatus Micrarchaeota archaeon]|nr:hypothetical protein [Candidatus Micrarchaeota archaeon]
MLSTAGSLSVSCPCGAGFANALKAAITSAAACDNMHSAYVDIPGILPLRVARGDCFAYSNRCEARCNPKPGKLSVLINPFNGQLYCFIHAGLSNTCSLKVPPGVELLKAGLCASPAILQKLSSRLASATSFLALIAVYRNFKNPLSETVSGIKELGLPITKAQGEVNKVEDALAQEQLPKEAEAVQNELTDAAKAGSTVESPQELPDNDVLGTSRST